MRVNEMRIRCESLDTGAGNLGYWLHVSDQILHCKFLFFLPKIKVANSTSLKSHLITEICVSHALDAQDY